MHYSAILPDVIRIADEAGERVLQIYQSDFSVNYKEDDSPITAADVASHDIIVGGLVQLTPNIPILSEEEAALPWDDRKHWQQFWLVDPVDGTREFAQRSDEFTVNIALIENGKPVLGVVTAPALHEAFWGVLGHGAFKRDANGQIQPIHVADARRVKRVVASKNHLNAGTQEFIDALGAHELVQAGSSLKLCRIAEGAADIYPRLAPTYEWDTAAAHAVLAAAGGSVERIEGGTLSYGKRNLLNPYFIAKGK
ncbi:MAG: 3'(2'),5'-bisphosphate nucleotidase CysQ [Pseudomonadota bacterium]